MTNKGVDSGPDGLIRINIGAQDTGDGYWLDTGGRTRGFVTLRWLDQPTAPEVSTRLVAKEAVR